MMDMEKWLQSEGHLSKLVSNDEIFSIIDDQIHQSQGLVLPWTTIEEDHIAFLLPAPKSTNCIKQVLTLVLSKTDS
jgi:hypothetical protein